MIAIDAVAAEGETSALSESIDIPRASFHRRRQPARLSTARSPRAIVSAQRQPVLDALYRGRFLNQSPAEVRVTLLHEQAYLCLPYTTYHVPAGADEVFTRSKLLATGPDHASTDSQVDII